MLFVQNISIYFSGISLLENINFNVTPKDKIGLIGKNGVGKSTILKCLARVIDPTKGSIVLEQGKQIGYLPQEIHVESDKSIIDEVKTVFVASEEIEKEIERIGIEMSTRTDYESESYSLLTQELSEKIEALELIGAAKEIGELEKVLKGLGFTQEDFQKPVSAFSGGWKMRIELAKLLILDPDILLLDEPTNHLDIDSIIWLESYFKNFSGAIIMISHDKHFLDAITNRTIEIVNKKIYDHPVAYSKFLKLREERISQQLSTFNNQQKYISQQERFIERFKAKASKAKQAQSKQKQLDKIERVEIDDKDNDVIDFRFPAAPRSGDSVVKGINLRKEYPGKLILDNLDLLVRRGEKVAFVGKNGQGKTTLVKMIVEQTDYEGEITLGHNVHLGYYAQEQENELDQNITVIQTIDKNAKDEWTKEHKQRALLGTFLFGEEDVNKRVAVLSGGEKSRLALALLLMRATNLLILDEPTNHLDIASKEILKQALQSYTGTIIIVSHDREFLDGLTNRTFEFKNKQFKEHIGGIDEFLNKHKVDDFRAFELDKKPKPVQPKKEEKKSPKKNNFNELKKLRSSVKKTETQISKLESDLNLIESEIAANKTDTDLFTKHAEVQKLLDKTLEDWENYSNKLEKLENE